MRYRFQNAWLAGSGDEVMGQIAKMKAGLEACKGKDIYFQNY